MTGKEEALSGKDPSKVNNDKVDKVELLQLWPVSCEVSQTHQSCILSVLKGKSNLSCVAFLVFLLNKIKWLRK